MPFSSWFRSFIIEKVIPTITGGYTYYNNQPLLIFWIHTLIFAWSFLLPLIIVNVSGNNPLSLIHPILTMLIWFVIKLINYQIHQDFDNQQQEVNDFSPQIVPVTDQDEEPPYGISKSVWRIRDYLTDFSRIDINTIFCEAIREGYQTNELFHFYDLFQSGQLNGYSMNVNRESHNVEIPTEIHILGCKYIVKWSRKDLESWFDRPFKLIDVVVSPLFAAVCGILCLLNSNFINSASKAIFVFSTAAAQYSLLLAPNPDSSSTTVQDPFTPYSRAFHLIAFQLIFSLLTYLQQVEWLASASLDVFNAQLSMNSIIEFTAAVFKYIVVLFPIFNMLGMIGSLKDSWFDVFETLHSVFFGKSGYISFYSANLGFLIDTVILVLLTIFHTYFYHISWARYIAEAASAFVGVYFASSNQLPLITKILGLESRDYFLGDNNGPLRTAWIALVKGAWVAIVLFIVLLLSRGNVFILYSVCSIFSITAIVTHSILPNLTMKNPYGKFSAPFFLPDNHYKKYMRIMSLIEQLLLSPLCIGAVVSVSESKNFGLAQWAESAVMITMIIGLSCTIYRNPVLFALSYMMTSMAGQIFDNALFQFMVYFLILQKISEIHKKIEFILAYSSFHAMSRTRQVFVLFTMLANIQLTAFGVLVSAILNSPIMPFSGYPLFLPSYPRPNVFWFEPWKYEPQPGDALFYKDISDSLAEKMATDAEQGIFPFLKENKFFLLCDDHFNAIVHVISSGVGYVAFQLRGLEARDQTLCHRNELQIVRSSLENVDEMRTFMASSLLTRFTSLLWIPISKLLKILKLPEALSPKQRAFVASCCWRTLRDDYTLESYVVSSNRVSLCFPDRNHQDLVHLELIRCLAVSLDENSGVCVPADFQINLPPEKENEILNFIDKVGKNSVKREILAVAQVIIGELNNIQGDFDWKLFKLFSSNELNLNQESLLWIPSDIIRKLVDCFRAAVSIAVHNAAGILPDDIDELIEMIREKVNARHVLPENDPDWAGLIQNKEAELETMRQYQDDDEMTVKYMMFTRRPNQFKLIEINGELVRGIWASEINETVFLESADRERPSIQFDSFLLRNIVAQSANSPVGYPEIICPISFSYSDFLK